MAKARKKYRADPDRTEVVNRRAKRRAESAARKAATVYECVHCAAQWSPVGRIPTRKPKYCSVKCRNAHLAERCRAEGICIDCKGPSPSTVRCPKCKRRALDNAKKARARKRAAKG
jgi:hypothetical protein